ncbi:MAG: GNAT family N-acetyltransferase [Alphaproteobacteria bacterium]|nr:GNAT family N-acetyltransferase [Alphaproteobacteria bacterium]
MGRFDDYERVALQTPNLVLEPLNPAHADEVFPHLQDAALYTYVPQNPPPDIEHVRARYTRLEHGRSANGRDLWLNWVIKTNAEAAGTVQATVMPDGTALIAYERFAPFAHKGIASEGVAAILAHLKDRLETKVARALVDTRNEPSIRLLERLGFERKRTIKDADNFKGATSDEYEYELRLAP